MLAAGNRDHGEILSRLGANNFLPAGKAYFAALGNIAQGLGMLTAEKP